MKQLMILPAILLSIACTATATTVPVDKKPHSRERFFEGKKNELKVAPNPKTGDAVISFKAPKAVKGTIVVLNEAGNTVLTQAVKLVEGRNKINVDNFVNLDEGYYTICLNTNYRAYSVPFLLWK